MRGRYQVEVGRPQARRNKKIFRILDRHRAVVLGYGTLFTGENAGKRLLAVGYPSLKAIENAYAALLGSDVYKRVLNDVEGDLRNIIRFRG